MKQITIKQNKSGNMILRARKKKDMSGSELCRKIGLTGLGMISMVECGRRRLPFKHIDSVSKTLDLDPKKLFNALANDIKADLEL